MTTTALLRLVQAWLVALAVGGCIGQPPWRGLWAQNNKDQDLTVTLDYGTPRLLRAGESGWVEAGDRDMPSKVVVAETDDCTVIATLSWDGRSDATLLATEIDVSLAPSLPPGSHDNVLGEADRDCRR
jgi:hypothetical protein